MGEHSTLEQFLEKKIINRSLVMQKLHWRWYWKIFTKKLWRSLNNKVSLAHFLLSCREGHPSDDNIEIMLSLRSLLQGQPSISCKIQKILQRSCKKKLQDSFLARFWSNLARKILARPAFSCKMLFTGMWSSYTYRQQYSYNQVAIK